MVTVKLGLGMRVGGDLKKSPIFEKQLISVAAFRYDFVSPVECFARVSQGDVGLFLQAELAVSHLSAVGGGHAEN